MPGHRSNRLEDAETMSAMQKGKANIQCEGKENGEINAAALNGNR